MNQAAGHKVALVTGGTGGIGSAITKKLAQNSYHVLVTHRDKSDDVLLAWLDSQMLDSSKVTFVNFDLTSNDSSQKDLTQLLKKFEIDVLINNAGITSDSKFLKMTFQEWNSVIQTNLIGLFNVTQVIAKQMVLRGSGDIINISSINGLKGQYGQTNYAASKAGILGFTRSLAQELAADGVRVNAIAPGYTLTPMVEKLSHQLIDKLCQNIPIKRLADPDEIAETVLFLCKGMSSITGETISVNGGHFMY